MKIAHMSDVHTLHRAYRPRLALGVRFLSFGRAVDPAPRIENLRASLAAAKRAGAGHVVISGDLTETGALDQFETFAETLDESGIHPDAFTLVPGNHDNYDSPNGWRDALRGLHDRAQRRNH
jgi:3',5'-cyclic AMP phosphodiesterase CpdA